mmetsp:Transcript_13675/g.44591  ORF Transcript_13675/g.44591 Transcript_13675/m.44591 type:complete len:202 (-) Transcript_13675:524-1129(-)
MKLRESPYQWMAPKVQTHVDATNPETRAATARSPRRQTRTTTTTEHAIPRARTVSEVTTARPWSQTKIVAYTIGRSSGAASFAVRRACRMRLIACCVVSDASQKVSISVAAIVAPSSVKTTFVEYAAPSSVSKNAFTDATYSSFDPIDDVVVVVFPPDWEEEATTQARWAENQFDSRLALWTKPRPPKRRRSSSIWPWSAK